MQKERERGERRFKQGESRGIPDPGVLIDKIDTHPLEAIVVMLLNNATALRSKRLLLC